MKSSRIGSAAPPDVPTLPTVGSGIDQRQPAPRAPRSSEGSVGGTGRTGAGSAWANAVGAFGASAVAGGRKLRVLLVEDDEADALLVRELLAEAGAAVELTVASSLEAARPRIAAADCVLLDLGLPDAQGIEALGGVLALASRAAVCVLTGLHDEHLGVAAVGRGAQDYLVKGQVDGVLLSRSLRYAVERKRADENIRKLREVQIRQAESARLERGLLPKPLMDTDRVRVHSFYRAGRRRGLIGGDFFDAVQTGPDRMHVMVGDVCGHGVDEAALGIALRVAWRALVLAGVPDDAVLPAVEQVLMSERKADEIFATAATIGLDLAAGEATVRLAGHPPPLLLAGGRVQPVAAPSGRLLGIVPKTAPAFRMPIESPDWTLLMYTDGLIEGRAEAGDGRLDVDGLCGLVAGARDVDVASLPAWLVGRAEEINGGPLADDVAMLLLTSGGGR